MALDKKSAQHLYLQLQRLIRSQIDHGTLNPGDRTPSELELARTHAISRMTARRAIDELVMDGTLVRKPGKGTFVAKDKMPAASIFSSFSTTMRSLGLAVTSKVLDLRLVSVPETVMHDLELTEPEDVVFLRRIRYVENEPMAVHISYMLSHYFARILDADLSERPLSAVMEEASGLHIAASRDYVEAAPARAEEAALLDIRKGAPVLLVRGVAYTREGTPMRSSTAVYRADRFRFCVEAQNGTTEVRSQSRIVTSADAAESWQGLSAALGGLGRLTVRS